MRLNRDFLRLVAAALLLVSASAAAEAEGSSIETLRLGFQKYGTLIVLKAEGSLERRLKDKGIAVTWAEFQGGVKVLEALRVGAIDFGTTGDAPPVIAQAQGAPFVYVAVEPPAPHGEALVVRADSPFQTVSDLKGKRIATSRGGNAHYLSLQSLAAAGLSGKDVTWSWLFPADARPALESGAVDAWGVWDPFLAGAQKGGQLRVLADGATAGVANHQFFLASRDLADKHPEIVAIILDELAKIDQRALQDPTLIVAAVADATGIDREALDVAIRRMGFGVKPLTAEIVDSQQKLADAFLKEGIIDNPITVQDNVAGASR
ncbi:aliphatic sulfonate ABC transporter substrate-binding protein [Hansschlegelia plantiphila]|uniref:Putative aliphatic sulfonates-binding protein n=1 Tax=Hansschlegelia plantiphila TaxID=374655 RepID=A0A9W6J1I0_9HYPH|nr:aliphatic sulfonate ABC transporter substrate-binding protein [Hansschlegelia plantiphila]GLK69002.1 sulfonate ABC transporter substrate-binding protein [Hansschlegelia plantiphila]